MTSNSNVVTVYDKKQNKEIKFYLDERLKNRLDGIKEDLKKKDKDSFIAVDGNEGCQPSGEKVLMADGLWKNVEDIKVGDMVLSPQRDGTNIFSKVLKTYQWFCDEMYDVVELNRRKKKLYSCSYNHLIPLNVKVRPRKNGERNLEDAYWNVVNYQASYVNSLSKGFKINSTTQLSFAIENFMNKKNCTIEPYTFGIWLGDGHFSSTKKKVKNEKYNKTTTVKGHWRNFKSGKRVWQKEHISNISKEQYLTIINRSIGITTMDTETITEIGKYYKVISNKGKKNNKASTYMFSVNGELSKQLTKYGLEGKGSGTKFIPKEVFTSDINYRKRLLAGVIDSDGYLCKNGNCYEVTVKSKDFAEGIYKIARSLGYRGGIRKVKKSIKRIGFTGTYFSVSFYIGKDSLPLLLERKKSKGNVFYLSSNRVSIDIIQSKPKMVYGFTLDSQSSWYITEDYIVTHNSGKSTLALQMGKYVDPTLNLSRVVFDAETFRAAILKAKKGQCVIFDEAFTGLSSRASLSGVNKTLISLMMQIRQKNLFVIIVLPTFFLLDKYVALFRSRALIHVYECKKKRGYFKVYNQKKKKLLYLLGKATYSYSGAKWSIKTRFKGRFYGSFALGDEEMDKKYRAKKLKALEITEKEPMSAGQIKYREQRDIILYALRKTTKMTYEQISNLLGDYDFEMSIAQVGQVCSKFGDKEKLRESFINKGEDKVKIDEKEVKEEIDEE